jgi:hypothetical protein
VPSSLDERVNEKASHLIPRQAGKEEVEAGEVDKCLTCRGHPLSASSAICYGASDFGVSRDDITMALAFAPRENPPT